MKTIKPLFFLLLTISILSCEKNSPCDALINGIYVFPEIPENHNMTKEEVDEFVNLPEDISTCISTKGLIETCLNYPYLSLVMAGSTPQSGYNLVKNQFRGLGVLESRPDRGEELLKKYQSIDPISFNVNSDSVDIARYVFKNCVFEFIFSQNSNLEVLTNEQKILLLETAIKIYQKKRTNWENYQVLSDFECTTALMAKLMQIDNFEPFINSLSENEQFYLLLNFFRPSNYEIDKIVLSLANQYLEQLKN